MSANTRATLAGRLGWRGLQSVTVVAGVALLTFVLVRVVPGDPAVVYAGERASPAQLEAVRQELGLDVGLGEQLIRYLWSLLQGDLGMSIATRQPVAEDLARVIPASIGLSITAIAIAIPLGVLAGIAAAAFRGRLVDKTVRIVSVLAVSFPVFWLALLIQSFFATQLRWFPVAGQLDARLEKAFPITTVTNIPLIDSALMGNGVMLADAAMHLVLPAIVIGAYPAGLIAQMTRSALIEQLTSPHAELVRAYGVPEWKLIRSFALRPAITPLIGVSGLVLASTLVGSALAEATFNWPGIGSYIFASVRSIDTIAVVGATLFIGIAYVVINALADGVHVLADPRLRVAS